jgi:hypothetical protein
MVATTQLNVRCVKTVPATLMPEPPYRTAGHTNTMQAERRILIPLALCVYKCLPSSITNACPPNMITALITLDDDYES